jgi:hypothetical protein
VVDDAPFTAVEVTATGTGRDQILRFRTNLDDEVIADAAHPIRVVLTRGRAEPAPYLRVRPALSKPIAVNAAGPADPQPPGLEALILRAVYYHLVELGDYHSPHGHSPDGKLMFGVWSCGVFFPLGEIDDDLSEDSQA